MADAQQPIDWVALAKRLSDAQVKMIHHEDTGLHGWEFDAEVLRRALGHSANDGTDGQRTLPYETVHFPGLITASEHDHLRNAHTVLDRMAREAAEKRAKEADAEVRRVYREARQDIAAALREWCNERSVPSRLRREGVLLAADRLDTGQQQRPRTSMVQPCETRDALAEVDRDRLAGVTEFSAQFERRDGLRRLVLTGPWEVDPVAASKREAAA